MLACVPVVVVLLPAQLVLMDGGLHLSSSVALRGLLRGEWPTLLTWRHVVPPNLTVEALIAGPGGLVDGDTAIRTVVVLALVGFAVGAVALVRAAGAPLWMVVLLLPVQMNAMVLVGLLGFVVAIVPALLAIAVVLRRPDRVRTGLLTVLLVLTWLTHLIPSLAALVAVIAVVLCEEISRVTAPPRMSVFARALGRALVRLAIPIVTVLGLTVSFFVLGGTDGSDDIEILGGGPGIVDFRKALVVLHPSEYALATMLALALYVTTALLVVVRIRTARAGGARVVPADGLLVAGVVIGLVAVVGPDHMGSVSYVASRLSVFLPVFLGTWIAAQWRFVKGRLLARRAVLITAVVAAVVAFALPLVRVPSLLALGRDLAEMRTLAACAPAGATVAQFRVDNGERHATRLWPMSNQVGYLAAERDLLDLSNISGSASYYLWTLRPEARPVPALTPEIDAIDETPARVTLGPAIAAGYPLDAVVVYGLRDASPEVLGDPVWLRTEADLREGFRRVAVTPTSLAELWVRADRVSPCG